MSKVGNSVVARSAITGRYVTAQTAVRNPRTTVVEKRSKRGK